MSAADPIEDYLAALRLLEGVADDVDVFVPGHGSIGGADQLRARIELDRAYVQALRDGGVPDDPRIGPSARPGWEWVSDVHAGQLQRLAQEEADVPSALRRGFRRWDEAQLLPERQAIGQEPRFDDTALLKAIDPNLGESNTPAGGWDSPCRSPQWTGVRA